MIIRFWIISCFFIIIFKLFAILINLFLTLLLFYFSFIINYFTNFMINIWILFLFWLSFVTYIYYLLWWNFNFIYTLTIIDILSYNPNDFALYMHVYICCWRLHTSINAMILLIKVLWSIYIQFYYLLMFNNYHWIL